MTHSIPPGRSSDHSVRDRLASRRPPEETGGDFAHDAGRLGASLGDLHLAMAEAWGVVPGDAPRWAAEMEDHLRGLVSEGSLDVPPTRLETSAVADRYHQLAEKDDAGIEPRTHGDLPLPQAHRRDTSRFVLDFEGQAARHRPAPSNPPPP